MPATTAKGHPYPLATEPVNAGAQAIRSLAESVDTLLPARTAVGNSNIVCTNAASAQTVVTFPAGRFSTAPRVVISPGNWSYIFQVFSITATGFTVGMRHYQGTVATATVSVNWQAVHMLAASPDG